MSAFIRLANLLEIYKYNPVTDEKDVQDIYTNGCLPGQSLVYNGKRYQYLSFIYQGAAKNRSGDNIESSLVLSTNKIAQGFARQAVEENWHVEVRTVVLEPSDGSVSRVLTTENWLASSMTYDPERLEVLLSSGIDAVGANAPSKMLTRDRVGNLPTTANLSTR